MKNGSIIEYYGEEGVLKFKGLYKNNFRFGKGVEFYKNGKIRARGNWNGDFLNEECEIYWDNGNLKFKGYFEEGLLEG